MQTTTNDNVSQETQKKSNLSRRESGLADKKQLDSLGR